MANPAHMFANLKNNRFFRFLVLSSSIYLTFYLFYQFGIKRYTFLDQRFIRLIINSSEGLLNLVGYSTFKDLRDSDFQIFGIDGSNGVWVGGGCNAITLFGLFSVFILTYPGEQKNKWWFILLGIITIHFLNIIRVAALAMISFYKPEYLDFNHTYTFTFVVYCYIFMLWMIWVNRFANTNKAEK
jgi:exosortase family protein XrtF